MHCNNNQYERIYQDAYKQAGCASDEWHGANLHEFTFQWQKPLSPWKMILTFA